MKKVVLSLGLLTVIVAPSFAFDKKGKKEASKAAVATEGSAAKVASEVSFTNAGAQNAAALKFETEVHDFGTIPEGPNAEYEFVFRNIGKEPVIIQRAQPSCGCTTPSYSKDPVLPGKTGSIKASYGTQGRPNAFTKTITVVTNVGTKVLTIKGNVEKTPESSVPVNSSMIKTN